MSAKRTRGPAQSRKAGPESEQIGNKRKAKKNGGIPLNINQIKSFLVTAECNSFTQAAEQLFITQPTLSHQISAMESELNLLLFVRRRNHSIQLTPAGRVLLEEFKKIYDIYNSAVEESRRIAFNIKQDLNIGILYDLYTSDLLKPALTNMAEKYPNIHVNIRNYSFNDLTRNLYNKELDVIFTLFFSVEPLDNLNYKVLSVSEDCIAMPVSHPAAQLSTIHPHDFKDDHFIIVSEEECALSTKLITDWLRNENVRPNIRYAPDINTLAQMVDLGFGVAVVDSRCTLQFHPGIILKPFKSFWSPSLTMAWHKDNDNFSVNVLLEELNKVISSAG